VVQADVREMGQVEAMLREVEAAFGGLDVLVNNAHSPFVPTLFEALTWKAVEEQVGGSVQTCFNCIQAALPYLRRSTQASVINISSITAQLPVRGFTHRDLAKAAVEGLTRSLALELGHVGIRVNALAVGWTKTEQLSNMPAGTADAALAAIPLSRMATPDEIAQTAIFLASPVASYITGMVMPVAGGLSSAPIPIPGEMS
jgi:3-oxoacyl-[acyl-carrier protein] reductase